MLNYILRRVVVQTVILCFLAVFSFFIIHLTPGNPVTIMLGEAATQERIDKVTAELGFDRPVYVQFSNWVGNAIKGDFGTSLFMRESVGKILAQRFPRTFWLAVFATLIAVVVGIPLGIISAIYRNSVWDRLFMVVTTAFLSIPIFVLAMYLILIFAVNLKWFPVAGQYVSPLVDFRRSVNGLFLPAFSISSMSMAYLARMARSTVLEVMQEDFIRTARAKGLKYSKVILKHMLRPASIPIITSLGLVVGSLLGGTIISETVFVVPGIGRLMVESVVRRDYVVLQALILLIGVIYSVVNLLTDVLYVVADPRIRYN